MTRLPNVDFTKTEITKIISMNPIVGGEAYICEGSNPNTLYKIFFHDQLIDEPLSSYAYGQITVNDMTEIIPMSYNKLKKIERLHQLQLEGCVRPLKTISIEGELVGYEMTKDSFDRVLRPYELTREALIYYLKQTKAILEYFARHNIVFGDVAPRNILINPKTRTAKFCDIDNIQLAGYEIDVKSKELFSYMLDRGTIDTEADAYMHSLMTLECLETDMDLCLKKGRYFHEYFKAPAYEIIEGIGNPRKYNGEYLIQYVKK